mmetsp:Transcript_14540/g.24109  ORF Transcript_14540/g.24109 Transcript_14540/m.24109 type:complete len:276 (+) Transcript_14540:138-965(+)
MKFSSLLAFLALASPADVRAFQPAATILSSRSSASSLSLYPAQAQPLQHRRSSAVSFSLSATSSETTPDTNNQNNEIDLNAEAEAIFDSIDVNKDGVISSSELRSHLVDMGYSKEYTEYLFESIDMDSDGEITRTEFRFAFYNFEAVSMYTTFGVGGKDVTSTDAFQKMSRKLGSNSENTLLLDDLADLIFDMIDTDQSGEIDVQELRDHFNTVMAKLDATDSQATEYVEDMMTVLDANNDGVVERSEMRGAFQKYDFKFLAQTFGLRVFRTAEV